MTTILPPNSQQTNLGPRTRWAVEFMEDVMSGQAFAQASLEAQAEALVARNLEGGHPRLSGPELIDDVEAALEDYAHALIAALIERLDL